MLATRIIKTLSYHSRFFYPLTFDQLHHFLIINRPVSPKKLKLELVKLVEKGKIIESGGFYYLSNLPDDPNFPNIRIKRQESSSPKFALARRAARILGMVPWVRLICATGSLAMNNADENDDIDVMIVTSADRLWLTRPLVIFLVSLFFKRRKPAQQFSAKGRSASGMYQAVRPSGGNNLTMKQCSNSLCLNLWLDISALIMPPHRQNLLTAHELAQMKPLVNKNKTYEKMIAGNSGWAEKFLANAFSGARVKRQESRRKTDLWQLATGNFLNFFLFRLQYVYMRPKMTTEEVNLHGAFFHPRSR